MKSLRPFWGILIVVGAFAVVFGIVTLLQPNEIIPWRTDLATAEQEAKSSGKAVFAYFTADWCGPCKALKHTTWADQKVFGALQHYVPVKIDIDRNPVIADKYLKTATNDSDDRIPLMIVMDDAGRVRKAYRGAIAPDDFILWLMNENVKEQPTDLAP